MFVFSKIEIKKRENRTYLLKQHNLQRNYQAILNKYHVDGITAIKIFVNIFLSQKD